MESDPWRDSLLRYAGYANECGEAFRHVLPRLLVPSYGVALLYVTGDTVLNLFSYVFVVLWVENDTLQ